MPSAWRGGGKEQEVVGVKQSRQMGLCSGADNVVVPREGIRSSRTSEEE